MFSKFFNACTLRLLAIEPLHISNQATTQDCVG